MHRLVLAAFILLSHGPSLAQPSGASVCETGSFKVLSPDELWSSVVGPDNVLKSGGGDALRIAGARVRMDDLIGLYRRIDSSGWGRYFTKDSFYLAFDRICVVSEDNAALRVEYRSIFMNSEFTRPVSLWIANRRGVVIRDVSGIESIFVEELDNIDVVRIHTGKRSIGRIVVGQRNDYRSKLGQCGSLANPNGRTSVSEVWLQGSIDSIVFQCSDVGLLKTNVAARELVLSDASIQEGFMKVEGGPQVHISKFRGVGERPVELLGSHDPRFEKSSVNCKDGLRTSQIEIEKGGLRIGSMDFAAGLSVTLGQKAASFDSSRLSVACRFSLDLDGDPLVRFSENRYHDLPLVDIRASTGFLAGKQSFSADKTGLPPVATWNIGGRDGAKLMQRLIEGQNRDEDKKGEFNRKLTCTKTLMSWQDGKVARGLGTCDPFEAE